MIVYIQYTYVIHLEESVYDGEKVSLTIVDPLLHPMLRSTLGDSYNPGRDSTRPGKRLQKTDGKITMFHW